MKKKIGVLLAVLAFFLYTNTYGSTGVFSFYLDDELLSSDVQFIGSQIYIPVKVFEKIGYKVMLNSNSIQVTAKEDAANGEIKLMDGSVFIGMIENGVPSGQGELITIEGSYYTGIFTSGQLSGEGRAIFSNGDVYKGAFKDGIPYGVGEMYYNDGGKYIGEFYMGVKHGVGKQSYASGKVYYGEWDLGLWSGIGRFTDATGKNTYAKWEDNRQIGRASREEFKQYVSDQNPY